MSPASSASAQPILIAAFEDAQLVLFCYDHYETVYRRFGKRHTHQVRAVLLVNYCQQSEQLDTLFAWVEQYIGPDRLAELKQSLRTSQESDHDAENEILPEIEPPFGTMRPNSPFYVKRTADSHCGKHFSQPFATTVFIQAPRQMGKSSLMHQVISKTKTTGNRKIVFIDFEKFGSRDLKDEEAFLIQFCLLVGRDLNTPEAIDKYWTGRLSNLIKCSDYLSKHILPRLDAPLVLAMDEAERLLDSPFRDDFFGMLRTWHNDRVFDDSFARLSLFISSSTEPYLFIKNPDQSPFNVAEPVYLKDFSQAEVDALNERHLFPLTPIQVTELMALLSGHPFLTRLSLYLIATGKLDFNNLIAKAIDDDGPYADHLRRYLMRIVEDADLKEALRHISQYHEFEENQLFHRIKGAGLIKKDGKQVVFRNTLYERYFEDRLNG